MKARRRGRAVAALVALAALGACGGRPQAAAPEVRDSPAPADPSPSPSPGVERGGGREEPVTIARGSARMASTPLKLADRCASIGLVAPLCPPVVPRTRGRYVASRYLDPGFASFDLSSGGVHEGQPARNRPPAFAHILLEAGTVGRAHPELRAERARPERLTDALLSTRRRRPVFLGARTLAGIEGRLWLMPPYPFGGPHGDHLIFRWGDAGDERVISLHSWIPATEALATLETLVSAAR
jgi:hypothetical protein